MTWLVRHGQSATNAGLPTAGQDDVPLTELGLEQAAAVACRVDRAPDLLIVSPFLRARATAAPIQARWPAESFRNFLGRLRDFHERLLGLDSGYVVAVGHGQFFRAYTIGVVAGFVATPEWMTHYRTTETANPIANCEIIELSAEAMSCVSR